MTSTLIYDLATGSSLSASTAPIYQFLYTYDHLKA